MWAKLANAAILTGHDIDDQQVPMELVPEPLLLAFDKVAVRPDIQPGFEHGRVLRHRLREPKEELHEAVGNAHVHIAQCAEFPHHAGQPLGRQQSRVSQGRYGRLELGLCRLVGNRVLHQLFDQAI